MNRFRTRRRAKDDSSASEQSSMPSFKSFRRGKKSTEEEPKKEFDLTSALPSDDNFRTSLLMTNLSARFSMLREQDDPNTKIGKASDDSVLFPRRQSRLADFGFTTAPGGLSDIAEVESIKAPFLRGQVDSYISDDADSTKGGGIMNRGKPTEGNVLFGGRQKIYKIPVGGSASTKGNGAGGMAGRALYEDDVAVSAFQLWRQTEKNRRSRESENKDSTDDGPDAEEAEPPRSESPSLVGYNRKRETSSTTSSASAIARYSTAATSITSQPATSARESQPASTAASTPVMERSVTRTRRLYEQALNQDMHDQQSSAFSRIDTLSRQRPMGNRTPDLAQISPSPTTLAFHERFGERRPILTKASAPNLRSLSPPATASSSSTLDLGTKAAFQPENRNAFGGSPPLSPPISETSDHALLPIQPNDRGKATAMGVFQKPAEPYDESKYAQRQLQLQSGRDTPNSRVRAESSSSYAPTWRSRSSSSMQRQPLETKVESARRIEPTVKEEYGNDGTLHGDYNDSPASGSSQQSATPQVVLQRPADRDHPAFRESALPTPLSMSDVTMAVPSEIMGNPDTIITTSRHTSPPDSPTLGPTSGLSGMVRHHLRSESNASSVYGAPQTAGLDARFPVDQHESMMHGLGAKSNPWISHEQGWNTTDDRARGSRGANEYAENEDFREAESERHSSGRRSTDEMESETDEFASQLADARRRVRERLTSYAETDSSREGSPLRYAEPRKDMIGQPAQVNALGIGMLKPKSSRGSLIDRSRTIVGTQSKAMKMLGIGAATMTTSPSPRKQSFDEKDSPRPSDRDGENIHPGLRAFRQARRELQRRKELETLARHQASQMSPAGPQRDDTIGHEQSTLTKEPTTRQRTPSRERKPPHMLYQQRVPSDESGYRRGLGSNSTSRQTSTERDRSGSEASNGPSDRRPTRLGNNSTPHDGFRQQQQLGPNNLSRQPMLRSPGLPGTDIRRSPIMPPQGYPGSSTPSGIPSPKNLNQSRSAANLTVQPSRSGYESHSGQPSPISPLGDPLELSASSFAPATGSTATSPTVNGIQTRRPSAPQSPAFSTTASTMNDSLRRTVNKHDISEPTFIMSTSRVPTVSLPQSSIPATGSSGPGAQGSTGSRSETATGQSAPPLPPINPLRKREGSGTIPTAGQAAGTNGIESTLRGGGGLAVDDDGNNALPDHTRAFRNTSGNNDGQGTLYWAQGSRQKASSHFIAAGPPASRTVLTPRLKPSNTGVPGGMF
ncbi:hypothetical protein CONLIGDRAFT_584513 [Coniochaeta ligniaria NRRL 30616]|uniref:Uncharacterized protein n=1 Tax=Coniochaeta ligniaria NRRL 30616 TaxID=1408157 RepID=A0A1J7IB68_9PEZI|nr:hypothetical protein CONLIGDRAFT_584513 [Coniochaeta ligniaria NRRL 30616]